MSEILTYKGSVYPWQCDHMGHMNIMWYVAKFDEANWHLFAMLGITPSYLRQNAYGIVAVQQNIVYKREVLAGDILEIHSNVLEVRDKVLRYVHEMRDAVTNSSVAE